MIFDVYQPTPALAEVVDHFWYSKIEMTSPVIQHYPTPLLQGLIFNFQQLEEEHAFNDKVVKLYKQAYFFGQPASHRVVTSNEKGIDILCVKFKPLGIAKITGINMAYISDCIISAESVWGREIELLCDEMQSARGIPGTIDVLERFLLGRYFRTTLHYRVENVDHALSIIEKTGGCASIGDIQNVTNTSRKTLERAFMNYLGMTPKLYSQIVRFNSAKEWIDKNHLHQNFSGLAFDSGFSDGSHFSAAFKRFSGMTPREYLYSKEVVAY